jgi:hypothetical protein
MEFSKGFPRKRFVDQEWLVEGRESGIIILFHWVMK